MTPVKIETFKTKALTEKATQKCSVPFENKARSIVKVYGKYTQNSYVQVGEKKTVYSSSVKLNILIIPLIFIA